MIMKLLSVNNGKSVSLDCKMYTIIYIIDVNGVNVVS